MTIDYDLRIVKIVETLLRNRRFFVLFHGKFSRWRISKNGLPKVNVLAPTLPNIKTNYRAISNNQNKKHFIYVKDSAIAIQEDTFPN